MTDQQPGMLGAVDVLEIEVFFLVQFFFHVQIYVNGRMRVQLTQRQDLRRRQRIRRLKNNASTVKIGRRRSVLVFPTQHTGRYRVIGVRYDANRDNFVNIECVPSWTRN
jgi:hypothetical protein